MAGRSDIKAGKAFVELYLKNQFTTQLTKALLEAKKTLLSMAAAAQFVGAKFNQMGGIALRAGGAISAPLLAALFRLEEAQTILKEIGDSLTESVGRPLLPILRDVRNVVLQFSEWAKRNPELIRTLFKIGTGLVAAGVALQVVGSLAMIVGVGFAAAATAFGALAATVAFIGTPLGVVALILVGITAAVVAGVAAWMRWTESGQAALKGVKDVLGALKEDVALTFGGIGDAILAGDIPGAARVAAAGMKAVFFRAIAEIVQAVARIGESIQAWIEGLPEWAKVAMGIATGGLGMIALKAGTNKASAIGKGLDLKADKLEEELRKLRDEMAVARKKAEGKTIYPVYVPGGEQEKVKAIMGAMVFSGANQFAMSGQALGAENPVVKKLDKVEKALVEAIKKIPVFKFGA